MLCTKISFFVDQYHNARTTVLDRQWISTYAFIRATQNEVKESCPRLRIYLIFAAAVYDLSYTLHACIGIREHNPALRLTFRFAPLCTCLLTYYGDLLAALIPCVQVS
jgi:hypothetical protein